MLTLSILPDTYAICRLDRDAVPLWAAANDFISITCTTDELSIVCRDHNVPSNATCVRGWRVFKVEGPLDLSLTGVLASLAGPLAEAQINLFVVSTYDTDYLLVKEANLMQAVEVLRQASHIVQS
jgi:hypothetical protein